MAEDVFEQEMPDEGPLVSGGIGGFAAGVVLGALLGAGIALLVAPDKGSRTRRDLRRRLRRLREEAADDLDQPVRGTARRLRRGRRRLRDRLERARDRLT